MAYVNVAEWKHDQVSDWLKGLDSSITPYIHAFSNNLVTGEKLLSLGPDDLEHLGIDKIGHQEIILEGVEHLRNIHYELDRENLQLLAMRLSCLASSLHNELCHSHMDKQRLSTQIVADIANLLAAVKPLIAWFDKPGFSEETEHRRNRREILSLALRMATCGQRDRFAENPVTDMKDASLKLSKLCESIVQEMTDPLILQPSSLDLATIKKRSSDDLGFYIVPSTRRIHQISELKLNSAAHQSGKIEPGDEIIQINYQTVVGWDVKQVMGLFAECPTDILLTLKKRPRHTKVYGQIYVKPYRLPSRKRTVHGHHPLAFAPRLEPLRRLEISLPLHKLNNNKKEKTENKRDSSSSDEEVSVQHRNLVIPNNPIHRRATITGASPLSKRPPMDIHELWHDLKLEKESASKKSTTSVIDFEERLSSTYSKQRNHSSSALEIKNIRSDQEPIATENLSIKERIELFSAKEKPKIVLRKPQIKINNHSVESISKKIIGENSVSEMNIPKEKLVLENTEKDTGKSQENLENEQHGKVVETIHRHLLVEKLGDDPEFKNGKEFEKNRRGLDILSNSLPHQGRIRRGISIEEDISTNSLPLYKKNTHNPEFDSELSRTISRVYKDDINENKETVSKKMTKMFMFPPVQETPPYVPRSLKPSVDYDQNSSRESLNRQTIDKDKLKSQTNPEMKRSFTSLQDWQSETSSCKSYSSSDYAEQTLLRSENSKINDKRPIISNPKPIPRNPVLLNADCQIPPVPPPRPSLAKPPSACYRAIMVARSIGKASPKTQRKKNPLISKGRNVSATEFPAVECDGWLSQRCRKGSSTWHRRWCLIHMNTLYIFASKQATNADTMVCLPGFTVSQADEVKSRQYAFKVYHTGTSFYFAADTNFDLAIWIDAITTSTLVQNSFSQEILFSESEGEDDTKLTPPKPLPRQNIAENSQQIETTKKFGSLKKFTTRSSSNGSSLDRKCLRILGNNPVVPVPTTQFRSYRKVGTSSPTTQQAPPVPDSDDSLHQMVFSPPEMNDYKIAVIKSTPPLTRRIFGTPRKTETKTETLPTNRNISESQEEIKSRTLPQSSSNTNRYFGTLFGELSSNESLNRIGSKKKRKKQNDKNNDDINSKSNENILSSSSGQHPTHAILTFPSKPFSFSKQSKKK